MTTTISPLRNAKTTSPPKPTAIDRIHVDLDEMVSRLRREIWVGGILAIGAATIASLLVLLVLDAIFQPESAWLRVALWIPMLGFVGMITRNLLVTPLKKKGDRLAMAWALEQKRPAIEERLTTSLQLSENPTAERSVIIQAVAQQAHGSLDECQDAELRGQEMLTRTIVAGVCLAVFALSMWIWAPYLIPSLRNVLNPLSARVNPHLNATIVPGNTHVAEGGNFGVTAAASHLTEAVLEVLQQDAVIASHQMATKENGRTAEFTLTGLKHDLQYRIRAGGLYSDRYQIVVDPKPVMKNSQVNVTFPEYTQLPPQLITDSAEVIEVIHGARIQIEVDSTLPAGDSSLNLNGTTTPCDTTVEIEESGLWRHSWEFTATADESRRGTITLASEVGVPSEPLHFDMRTLPDLAPSILIDQPALSEMIVKPDQSIRIDYLAVDDFGCSALHLTSQKNGEPSSTRKLQHELQAEFGGEWTIDLNELELAVGDQLTVWLSISDNRPEEYGGSQSADSRKIQLQIAEDSIPVGQQVVRNEEQSLLADLTEALDQLQAAAEITDEIQALLGADDGKAHQENDAAKKSKQLQDRIKDAVQALRRMSAQDELAAQRIFQAEIERIQEVTENEVREARKQAGLVSLSDELPQKQEAIAATKESLNDAIDKLEEVRADVEERGKQLELASRLDELARKQEQLAQAQQEGRENAAEVQEQQQRVADELQQVVEQDLDAKSEQFTQRAEAAAKLKEEAAELQQQQEALAKLDQVRSKEELDDTLLEMIAQEQKQIAGETRALEEQRREEEQRRDMQPPAAEPLKQAQEEPNEAGKAERKEKPTALTEARKQMEAVRGKIRQKELEQAEVEARQARDRLQEEALSVPKIAPTQPDANAADNAQQTKEELERLAKQQERVGDAIKAVRENRPAAAVATLQEQLADRTERLRDNADELLQLPTEDPENQQGSPRSPRETGTGKASNEGGRRPGKTTETGC